MWNLTPLRMVQVHWRPSSDSSHFSAIPGIISVFSLPAISHPCNIRCCVIIWPEASRGSKAWVPQSEAIKVTIPETKSDSTCADSAGAGTAVATLESCVTGAEVAT